MLAQHGTVEAGISQCVHVRDQARAVELFAVRAFTSSACIRREKSARKIAADSRTSASAANNTAINDHLNSDVSSRKRRALRDRGAVPLPVNFFQRRCSPDFHRVVGVSADHERAVRGHGKEAARSASMPQGERHLACFDIPKLNQAIV